MREDTAIRELKIHNIPEYIKHSFSETNLIRIAFCGSYHLPSQYDQYFFENIGKMLDKYSNHDKFILVDDFNA